MTLKNRALQILILLFVSGGVFGQKKGNLSQKKDSTSTFSEKYNTWGLGFGASNLIMHGDLRSLGTGDQGNFYNFGTYLYIDKMFNPILGVELKFDYSKLGGASQYFTNGYDIKYLNQKSFIGEDLILEGYKYGLEVDGIINLTNLWKLNSKKWSLSFMAGMGYHRYTSKLLLANDATIDGEFRPAGYIIPETNFEVNGRRESNDHASSIYLNTSLSLKRRLGKRFDIELRPVINLNNEDHFDAAISNKQVYETFFTTHLGITYKFGKKDKYAIWINEDDEEEGNKFEIVDSDDDGVMDELDKEPETPKEANVYGSGIAIDTDKDGIPDHKDKCPLVPGAEANEGCPEDKDGDGIFDIDDVCPEVRGTREYLGCPKQDNTDDVSNRIFLLSKSIYFKTDSDVIKGDSYSILNEIASIMLQYPKTQFKIDGHTDDRAPAYYNMNLSERRATSVLGYLTNKGVNTYRLYSEGFGEENPTHSNDTEQGRKFNRRVEINFIQPDSEKGAEIYEEGTNITESVNIIQPQTAGMMEDGDGDGVADVFDKEPDTPRGALVYGNGVSLDTDKDGIPDYSDECPLQYGIAAKNGCPAVIEGVTSTGEGITINDTDGDGVIDLLDAEADTPVGAKVYGNGVAIDTDNDGIIDLNDNCPLKPGAPGSDGCPTATDTNNGAVVNAKMTITDTDGDGVIDELDVEKDTPVGAKVYGNGVAIDTDNDGVIDLNDKCPLRTGKPDNDGCPLKTELTATGTVSMDDEDGDGVINSLDQEPDTSPEARVYGNGVAVDTDGDGTPDHIDNCPLKYGSTDKQGCPLSEDTDNDGVPNEYDKEPNTPFGVKVYGNGVSMDTDSDGTPDHKDACPLKPGESSNGGCPTVIEQDATGTVSLTDSDGDGVVDQFDQEPSTPKNSKVYGNGVSVDTDNDGTPDYKDACPLKPGTIEKEGCPETVEGDETGSVSLIDSDGDGVVDQFDKEANTPANAKVYGNGVSMDTDSDGIPDHADTCPIKPGTKENNGCPTEDENKIELIDTDGDGVIDTFDQDPNTPKGALVYGNGIPIDSDRDGLPDYKDKCPLKAGPVEKEGCPAEERKFDWGDTDGDGVVNEFDKEPNTPANARVYGNGISLDSDYDEVPDHSDECPFKAGPVENKGCPKIEGAIDANVKDTDKDGVLDLYDKEPNTPFGVKVYSNGVSIDSDKDKVPDYKDRCPLVKGLIENEGCPKGKDLDGDGVTDDKDLCPDVKGTAANNGCPDKNFDKSVSLKVDALARKISFERTKNTLTTATNDILDEIITIMEEYPATRYQIATHTDNKHNSKYSLFLSKRRATAIMKYIINGGIDEDRLTAEGYGDTLPKYPNSGDLATSELNNRVEFNFVLPK